MNEFIHEYLDGLLSAYSGEDYHDRLYIAKLKFFELTGKVDEDSKDEYENKMNFFNDWYLFNYINPPDRLRPIIEESLEKDDLDEKLKGAFFNANFSLYEFKGGGLSGRIILYDLFERKNIKLNKNHELLSLVKGDLFLGRVIDADGYYLLPNLSLLPSEVGPVLKKEAKKIKKLKDQSKKIEFLLKVEYLKTKWIRFGRLNMSNIFKFN